MDEDCTLRKGTVLSLDGGKLVVRIEQDGEEECGGCRACSLRSLCNGRETGHMDLSLAAPEEKAGEGGRTYRPGDVVTVEYARANVALAAGALFVPALAGLALGGWLGSGFGDAALLAGCALGFAAGVGVSRLLSRTMGALRPKARLVAEE